MIVNGSTGTIKCQYSLHLLQPIMIIRMMKMKKISRCDVNYNYNIILLVVFVILPYRCSSFQLVAPNTISPSKSSTFSFSVANCDNDAYNNNCYYNNFYYNCCYNHRHTGERLSSSSSTSLLAYTRTQGAIGVEENILDELDEETLSAAIEDGTIDIDELNNILGEDVFDFDEIKEEEEEEEEEGDNFEEEKRLIAAAVENGTIDITELEDMIGEEFDFDDYNNGDVDNIDDDVDNIDGDVDNIDYDEDIDIDIDEDIDIDIDEEKEEENDMELLVQFMEHCRETPIGDLELVDADLMRQVMENFISEPPHEINDENEENDFTLKASNVVESLVYRLVDEWKSVALLLKNNSIDDDIDDNDDNDSSIDSIKEERKQREHTFRPVADDFYRAMVAIWKDGKKENNDSFDDKANRIWNLFSEQKNAISLLEESDDTHDQSLSYPNIESIEILLKSMSMSRERGIERKASFVVEKLVPKYGLTPNPSIYGPYIQIVAKARNRGAARQAELILRKVMTEFPPPSSSSLSSSRQTIGVDVFNTVVTAYAKARGERDGPKRAQELIVFMDELGSSGCAPNAKTFTSLVDAYAQTNDWHGVGEAQAILNNLLDQYLKEGHLEPNVATWTIVIAAWQRLSKKGRRGAAKRAGDLLRRMESLSSLGRISVKPDAITYVTCFNAYAYSKTEEDAAEAERLLEQMNEMYLDGDDTMQPSVRSIKVLLDAWIKVGAIDKAEKVLNQYKDTLIDVDNNENDGTKSRNTMKAEDWKDIYRSILMGYTLHNNPKRATAYLKLMIDTEDIEPDIACYNRIIDSYIRLGERDCAKRSQEIFELVESRCKVGALSPDERVFTSFIKALTVSKVPGLYKKADLILKRTQSLGEGSNRDVQPTISTYNAVLNACAESADIDDDSHLHEAFQTSVRVFTKLRDDMDPDHITFENLIRCADLLPSQSETRDKFITATFKLCCKSGHVNNYFIRDLCSVASKDLWTSLTGFTSDEDVELDLEDATILLEGLPTSWQRQRIDREKPPPLAQPSRRNNNYR